LASRLGVLAWQNARAQRDPVTYARRCLAPAVAEAVDARVAREVDAALDDVRAALSPVVTAIGGAR
jgi:hypothetical protein